MIRTLPLVALLAALGTLPAGAQTTQPSAAPMVPPPAPAPSIPAAGPAAGTDAFEFMMAKIAAEDADFTTALARIDTVIEHHPDDAILLYERAMILLDASKVDRAESELRKLTAAHPDFYDAQRILGRLLFDRSSSDKSKLDEALAHLQAAYKINPDDISVGTVISQLLLQSGRTAEAATVLAAMLERAPDQRGLNFAYAQVLTKLGQTAEARQYLERAVAVDPTFGAAIFQLLDIYQKQGEWEKAAETLQTLSADDPTNVDLQKRQALLWLRAGRAERAKESFQQIIAANPKDVRSQFFYAEALTDLEQYDQAAGVYRKLLEKSPDDPELLASYGLNLTAQSKWDDAAKTFEKLLATAELPETLKGLAQMQLGMIELQKGNYDAAVRRVTPILVFQGKPNPQAVNIAIEALHKDKNDRQATLLLQPLAERYPTDSFVNARYLEALLRAGETKKAEELAAKQATQAPRNAIAAAETLLAADKYDEGISLLRQASKANPDDLDLLYDLGSAYERAGKRDDAEKTFTAVLAKNPDHGATLNYLGYMWAERGQNLDRAVTMLEKAVSLEPRNGAYVDSLGWAYYQQGHLDQAEAKLSEATKLLPRDSTVRAHLADVVARRGDAPRAIELYRQALKLDPTAKDEISLKSKIADLEKGVTAK